MHDYKKLVKLLYKSRPSMYFRKYATTDKDLESGLKTQIAFRDESYTELLDNYINITRVRNVLKELHKWVFFWAIVIASVIGMWLMFSVCRVVLANEDYALVIEAIPALITALVSFVATIIVVPRTIAEFLFNTHEDDNITEIIKHTQKHDASGRNLFKGYKHFENEKKDENIQDDEFEQIVSDGISEYNFKDIV